MNAPSLATDRLPRRLLLLLPLAVFVIAGVAFWRMLAGMQTGTFDPRGVPSQLIGKPVPTFNLPALPPAQGFSSADLAKTGHPVLVNFFASWCIPCVQEAPQLQQLAAIGVPIWGIAYKDKPDAATQFLQRNGDPYARLDQDVPGLTAINFGVYGVPETYFVDRTGVVRWRWAGPLTPDIVQQQLEPLLRKYQ